MQKNESRLTVYFNGVFWVGVYERVSDGRLEACKITFGAEPKDYEIYQYLLQNWSRLRFSPPVSVEKKQDQKLNPKRMQRLIKKELESHGTGTKSQQALNLLREENKMLHKELSRSQKEEEKQIRFEQKQQKRRDKHRGH